MWTIYIRFFIGWCRMTRGCQNTTTVDALRDECQDISRVKNRHSCLIWSLSCRAQRSRVVNAQTWELSHKHTASGQWRVSYDFRFILLSVKKFCALSFIFLFLLGKFQKFTILMRTTYSRGMVEVNQRIL